MLDGLENVKAWYGAMGKRKAFQKTTQATPNYLHDYMKYATPQDIPKALQK
eukprot:TRINITY_DN3140_c0_g1_i1.p1 TRINITY_DN3140_c0_g1~~TRINITY_DN3140_c0_g1_i1.p1  ORF type:complete len:61 (-),score=14.04 TRINITY_DN3140_c0_g1_i1:197-349(-)